MKILLLSAYDAQSHKRWRTGLVAQFPEYQWTVLSLPARFFSWRLRGNAYSWFMRNKAELEQDYDLIIATSMTELSVLRGILPRLGQIPTMVYFHENQFAYPLQRPEQQRELMHFRLSNLYTAICGDSLVFNSEYNRETFLQGLRKFLKSMPDFAPRAIVSELESKSQVLSVPLELELFSRKKENTSVATDLFLVWNHRWEYDKGPVVLFKALELCKLNGLPFKIAILGQQFSSSPDSFQKIQSEFAENIIQFGYLPSKEEYLDMVQSCDIVLSTALHEFQGLAVLESIALGLTPIAPNRLSYPEFIPEEYLYQSHLDNPDKEAFALYQLLEKVYRSKESLSPYSVDVSRFSWKTLRPLYKKAIEALVNI